jgi:hypothetical protein
MSLPKGTWKFIKLFLPMSPEVPGQLNGEERRLIASAIVDSQKKPMVALEVGTWLGGGSTATILRALDQNGQGHLWGIEADLSIYEQMLENIRRAAPEAAGRFTPLFGFSDDVIPQWISRQPSPFEIDFAFLDGGNNPGEQVTEFKLIDSHMPVGAILMSHDAKLRKGKWLVPYLSRLDNWQTQVHDVSEQGLLHARKIAVHASASSRRAAATCLFKLRCNPIEMAAAVLPSRICGYLLKLMPKPLAKRISETG